MIKYRPNTDWFYKPITVNNLDNIKKELIDVFWKFYKEDTSDVIFGGIPPDFNIATEMPALTQWLKDVELDSRHVLVNFAVVNNTGHFPVHIDYINSEEKFVSINIPLLNCDKSYTVWYDAEVLEDSQVQLLTYQNNQSHIVINSLPDHQDYTVVGTSGFYCDEATAVEIERVECLSPLIVNAAIPHRPDVQHDRLRVQACLRIRPELTDQEISKLSQSK